MNLNPGGFIIAAALAIFYGSWLTWQEPSRLRTIVKTLSIGSLALLSYRLEGPLLLTIALALSAAGDAFLANQGERNFIFGLGSFLLAHLVYSVLFAAEFQFWDEISLVSLAATIALGSTAFFVFLRLLPYLGKLKLPVFAYMLAILMMGVSALSLQNNALIMIGAVLFMASDIILSHELFVWKAGTIIRNHSPWMIWSLYWCGQALIAWAYLSV